MLPKILRWRDWNGDGLEHLVLTKKADQACEIDSTVICGSLATGFAATYSMRLDPEWRFVDLQASVLGSDGSLYLRRSEQGQWFDGNTKPLHQLDGVYEVDLSITPFTNTLPIRRLKLNVGESAEILAAYIQFPQLTVTSDPQRYTRVASDRYRYESLDSDFVREITVDPDGFVVSYPGLFQRID